MLHTFEQFSNHAEQNYTKPAILTRIDETGMWVRLEHQQASFVVNTINALSTDYVLKMGDKVLVSGDNFQTCYIIGVINETGSNKDSKKDTQEKQEITTKQGASAKYVSNEVTDTLSVTDENGYLLFEYDAVKKSSKIYSPKGDISFNAENGNIDFLSANNISCTSMGAINLNSASTASINVASDNKQSSINFTNNGVLLGSESISVNAKQAKLNVSNTLFTGQFFKSVLNHSKQVVDKIETIANVIKLKATNSYKDVEKLDQTRSGRMRTLVKTQMELKSQSAYIESKKAMNIDGEKINLG
ncbi:DUF3540 domain-containing protein [Marinicellulosiphila megalodicopiae]|uniref:DUF3540 domain-containing protein n=1 Tax=Marinicellulosiphila megalodicopiae TaxID=2724896 RepID=UPI003BAEE51C